MKPERFIWTVGILRLALSEYSDDMSVDVRIYLRDEDMVSVITLPMGQLFSDSATVEIVAFEPGATP